MAMQPLLFLLRAITLLVLALVLILLGMLVVLPMHVKPPFLPILMLGLAHGLIWAGIRRNPPAQAGVAMAAGMGLLMMLLAGVMAVLSGFVVLWPIVLAMAAYTALGLGVLFAEGRSAVDWYDVLKGAVGAVLVTGSFMFLYFFPFLRI